MSNCDDTRGVIRPVQPEDADALVRMFDRLSPQSIHRRFFTLMPRLDGKLLEWMAVADHHDHEGVLLEIDGEIVGIAHYQRLASDPRTAEVAVLVEDDCQRRGIARRLLNHLTKLARAHDIDTMSAVVLSDNRPMRALMQSVRPDAKPSWDGGDLSYRFPITRQPGEDRSGRRSAVRRAASDARQPSTAA